MKNRKLWVSIIAGLLALTMLMGLVAGVLPRDASAASSSELKEQLNDLKGEKDKLMQQIKDLEKQQSQNFNDMQSLIKQKDVIDQQVALLYAEMRNVDDQIAAYSLLISDKQEELELAQKRLAELNEKNKERIRAMEEEGELSYWSVLFKANSFSDLLDRLNMINEIAAADRRRLKEMSEAAQIVEKAKADLTAEKAELEKTKIEQEQTRQTLEAKNKEADKLLEDLVVVSKNLEALHSQFEKEEEDFLDEIAKKQDELDDALDREASIAASIKASIEASIQESIWIRESIEESRRQEAMGSTKPTSGSNSGSLDNPSGVIWRKPCVYTRVTSSFGYRWHPVTGEWSMHKGVALNSKKGSEIYATRSGTVSIASWSSTAGNYVQINHGDGYSSIYMHMTHYIVKEGDYVKAGEVIGYVGSTGRSTGPHLHFGISYKGSYVNPMDYIG